MVWTPQPRPCEVCGVEYRYSYSKQRTCSRTCGVELRRREGVAIGPPRLTWPQCKVFFPICRMCGERFTARSSSACLCSDRCRKAAAYQPRSARAIACANCGVEFLAKQGPAEYCSKSCAQRSPAAIAARRSPQERRRRAEARRRRRARLSGVRVEVVVLEDLLIRDAWRCGICGKRIRKKAVWPDLDSPTLDHVVPLARGGEHSKVNCQPAHFICNSTKSDSGESQMLLFG